jgi:KTSC domain
MKMTDTTNRSTNIARVGYDAATQSMEITFKSGGRYRYHNVSPIEHQRFMESKSLGRAFNQMFWGQPKRHPSQKLEPTSGH